MSGPQELKGPDLHAGIEGSQLAEWIEFHRLVGVERFFLLDNESDDESLEVLAPYIDKGIVVRYERRGTATGQQRLDEIKLPGFQHCIDTHGAETRWMAFIDTDEFLFSPTGRPVPLLRPTHSCCSSRSSSRHWSRSWTIFWKTR